MVLTRPPGSPRAKTRLGPALPPRCVRVLAEGMLADTLDAARGCAADARRVQWDVAADAPAPAPPPGFTSGAQRGGDLGARILHALTEPPAMDTVVIGSDCPELGHARLERAFQALADTPLVLGPASDGGFHLIGCAAALPREDVEGVLRGVAWGGATVRTRIEANADQRAVGLAVLAELPDIDRPADLVSLIARLSAADGRHGEARHTRAALRALRLLP